MPDPTDPKSADAEDADLRRDGAGFDVAPPPGLNDIAPKTRGLSDDVPPEREGWSEFDAEAAWTGDETYPLEAGDDALDGGLEEDGDDEEVPVQDEGPDAGGDLMERVLSRLEDDEDLTLDDLSVELRGAVVVLRGLAATPADRVRAGDLARAVRGVERVENELSADADDRD